MLPLLSGLAVAGALVIGCSGDKKPDPKEPAIDDEPALVDDVPPPASLKAGLIITSSPSVEIQIDGKSVGETPLEVNDLEPGSHDVTFLFEGDEKMTQTVNLGEGETKKLNQNVSPDSSDAIMGGN